MNNNSNNCGDCGTTCSECGRPWAICKQDGGCGCNKCKDIKFCEYGRMANGCIREKQPGCPMQAVIPSVTVESIEGIKNLADCLVHVSDINTTFYIDDKHRPIITWAGPIDIPGYDMEGNPNNYRDQIVTDVANQIAVIYDKSGNGYTFGLAENLDVQEEINNKLDQMAADGTLAEIIAKYATTKEDYFYINSESTSADIINAFASPKSKIIEFEKGTYNVTGSIILSSNTEVLLNGSTLNSSEGIGIFGYALDSEYTEYNGVSNVAIKNGKIGNSIALMHNTNITFENIEFLGTIQTHALQIAGCKHIVIDNCVFNGMVINDTNAEINEILQLEICDRGAQPYLIDEASISYDNTGNYDITISNCIFNDGDGVNSKQYISIGNHTTYGLNTLYNKNINIIGNTFNNAHFAQVVPACFENCLIENNTFTQPNSYTNEINNINFKFINKDVIIRNNKFDGGDYNISSFGVGVGYNENIYIEGNEFNTEFDKTYSCNILLKNFKNVVINNNKFGKAFYKNIWLHNATKNGVNYKATNVDITGNTFKTGNIISSSKTCVHVRYGENINICRNIFTLSNAKDTCIYIFGADVNGYLVSDNDEITTYLTKRIVLGTNLNYTNIYDAYRKLSENQTAYSAITDGSLAENLDHFNRLCLVLHKSNDASVMYTAVIKEYDPTQRFQIGRTYPLSFADASGNLLTGVLSLNTTGNTYSWSSSNNLTLRLIYGYNEI